MTANRREFLWIGLGGALAVATQARARPPLAGRLASVPPEIRGLRDRFLTRV